MPEPQCALLDHFAILIQILLGALAFSTLIYKRHRERPQRPVRIWLFDVGKQVIGACVMHGLNLLVSHFAGKSEEEDTDPCVWYFLNILLDCTLGVFLLYVILKLLHKGVVSLGAKGMISGEYGNPPKVTWWAKQLVVFLIGCLIMKFLVVLLLRFAPFLFDFGEWALGWTLNDKKLQVVFVFLIFPLIMNIIQFWLVDQVIKKHFEHVKLEDPDAFGDEDAFLPRDYNSFDEETQLRENPNSYHVHGKSISSNAPTSLGRTSPNEDKENVVIQQQKGDNYIELTTTIGSPKT